MKIKSVKATVHSIPVVVPLIKDPIEQRRFVFCEVESDEGHVGYGLTGHFLPFSVAAAIEKDFGPLLRGKDPRDTEAIHEQVWWRLNPRTMTGVVSSAMSALDIALWDLHGKATGRTVAELLGGARDHAGVYITYGFPQYDREQIVEAAKQQVSKGFRRLKLVVAVDKGGWREDAKRIHLVRDAVGEDVDLMIDANYMLRPVEARMLCRAVEDARLTWFEEPLHQNDARALADLRRHTGVPISAGQMEGHRWRLRELVEHQAVDILQPNCCYNGGYTETRKVAHLAQTYNLPIANGGGWPRFNMHTMAGLMNGWLVEFHLGMKYVEDHIFKNPPEPDPKDNVVRIPKAPGLGLEPNKDVLKDTLVRD